MKLSKLQKLQTLQKQSSQSLRGSKPYEDTDFRASEAPNLVKISKTFNSKHVSRLPYATDDNPRLEPVREGGCFPGIYMFFARIFVHVLISLNFYIVFLFLFVPPASGGAILGTQRYLSKRFLIRVRLCLRRVDCRYTTLLLIEIACFCCRSSGEATVGTGRCAWKGTSYPSMFAPPARRFQLHNDTLQHSFIAVVVSVVVVVVAVVIWVHHRHNKIPISELMAEGEFVFRGGSRIRYQTTYSRNLLGNSRSKFGRNLAMSSMMKSPLSKGCL